MQLVLLALTGLATAICGYHPYAEDAGIYVAGVKLAISPKMYSHDSAFVLPYARLSIFPRAVAELVRLTHLPIEALLVAIQFATTWLLLYSCWQVARRSFEGAPARWGSVALVAVLLTIPVAGSALFLMDPYVTSRSFSAPLTLLAVCACLDRRPCVAALYLVLVGLFHPLMSIYAAGFLLFLWLVEQERWSLAGALSAGAVACGAALQQWQRNVAETSAYVSAVLSRRYFFLERWEWYELVGIIAPLLLLFLFCRWRKFRFQEPAVALAGACVAEGLTAVVVSMLYSRPDSHSHLIARIQTIRTFHVIYFVLFLTLGGLVGQYFLKRVLWRWAVTLVAISAVMLAVQLGAYPASNHFELPWRTPRNQWAQAFLWARAKTPANAIFAMDADYIALPGEDGHVFRAMAERSSLADYWKDGGTAAVFPQLAPTWMRESTAEKDLDSLSDVERASRLAPFGVTWIILRRGSRTSFSCPYKNAAVMVCRLV